MRCVWIPRPALLKSQQFGGRLAQLGERIVRNDEAGGSIPPPSTKVFNNLDRFSKLHRKRFSVPWLFYRHVFGKSLMHPLGNWPYPHLLRRFTGLDLMKGDEMETVAVFFNPLL